jgi:RNA polymerase sigma-70 factor (ECF subfamily)
VGEPDFLHVLKAAQAGEHTGVAALYRSYNPMLVHFTRAQVPGMGEDLAQDTWLAAGPKLREFRGDERSFRVWLLSIARSQVARQRDVSGRALTTLVDPYRLTGLVQGRQPDDVRVADAAIAQLLAGLPQSHAEILLLRVVGGLSAEETGSLVGKSPGAVRVIQHRALRGLAERLSPHAASPESWAEPQKAPRRYRQPT